MRDVDKVDTILLGHADSNMASVKLAAVNNVVRLAILEILRDSQNRKSQSSPLYSREINDILLNSYNIDITPQMIGQHMKQLMEAELVEECTVKKEVPNRIGPRSVKGYVLKEDAFKNLFLEISFLSDELLSFFDMYESNIRAHDGDYCVLTVFNGVDKGKTFKVHKSQTALIGRGGSDENLDESGKIVLDSTYSTVSSIDKPHLKLFYKEGHWHVLDSESSNGTYIVDREIPKGVETRLKNNSFLKLSRGNGGVIIYFSF